MATEPPGGSFYLKCRPNRPLLDKEQERREVLVRYSIQGGEKLVGGHGKTGRRAVF